MAKSKKIGLAELHPFLRLLYGLGIEPQLALAETMKREANEKIALNLTYDPEEDRSRPSYMVWDEWDGLTFGPKYHLLNKWRLHLGTEKDGEFRGGLSFGLIDVTNEAEGLKHLERIADELQRIYRFPYRISFYIGGKKNCLISTR